MANSVTLKQYHKTKFVLCILAKVSYIVIKSKENKS